VDPYNIAAMHAALGDQETAVRFLKEAVRERSPSIFFLNVEPWFAGIRRHPAYAGLLRAMDLR
jgi:hypothetical protein